MSLEIWKAPAGLNYAGSNAKPPEGEGWQITGYSTVRIPMNPNRMGSGFRTEQVPIYGRSAPAPAPPPPPPAPAPAPAPAPITPQTPYTQTIPQLEAEVDKAEKAVPTIPQPNAIDPTIKALQEQVKALTDQLSINSTQQIGQAVEQTTPLIDPELVKAREAIEELRSQMMIQSEAFLGETAAQQMMAEKRLKDAQLESQRQQQEYRQSISSLQNRLSEETANYRAELQGLNESQRAFQVNQTRAAMAPEFQISSAENRQVGGTQPFKIRRPSSFTPAMMGITSGALNANNLNVLNI